MKLSELIHEIWKDERTRKLGIRKSEVTILVKVTLDHIREGLLSYGKIKLLGLFTIEIRKAKGRKIAHPRTGEKMYSKDYFKLRLEPSKKLKSELKEYKNIKVIN